MLAQSPTPTLLALQRTVGNQVVAGLLAGLARGRPTSGEVIQRYALQEVGKAPEARSNQPIDLPKQGQFHYAVGQSAAPRWRVSNDGEMAVPDVAETKDFYANDAVATASNAILKAGDSILEFVAQGPSVEVGVPSRPSAVATLKQLKPMNRWNKQESKELQGLALIEHQCFITAHAVLGKRNGIRTQTGQAVFESGPEHVVQNVKYETVVPVAEFVTKPSAPGYSPKEFEKSMAMGPKQAESSPQPVDEMVKQKSVNEAYNHVSEQDRKLRSKELGINQFAVPEVGEAIATFSTYLPDTSKWNFHFAGVVAKSGPDFVTLENYTRTSDFRARLVEFAKGVDELFAELRKAEPKINEKKNDYQKAIAKGREQLVIAAKELNIPREIGSLEELASFIGKLGDIAEPDRGTAQKELEGALFAVVTVLNRIGGNTKRISNMLETATGADNEDVVKALWYFQMYGPANQDGQDQSFHTEMIKPKPRQGQVVPQSEFEGPVTLRMRSDTSNVAPLDVSLLEIQEPQPPPTPTGLMSYLVKPAADEQDRYKKKQQDYGKNVRGLAAAITAKKDEVLARRQTVIVFEKEFTPVAKRGGLESRHALFVNQMIEFGSQQRRLVDAVLKVTAQREYKAQFKGDTFDAPLGELAMALMLFGQAVASAGKIK